MRENRFAYLLIIVILFIHNGDYIEYISIFAHITFNIIFMNEIFVITLDGLFFGSKHLLRVPRRRQSKRDYLTMLLTFQKCVFDFWLKISSDKNIGGYHHDYLCMYALMLEGKLTVLIDNADKLSKKDIAFNVYVYSTAFVSNCESSNVPIIFDFINDKFYNYV